MTDAPTNSTSNPRRVVLISAPGTDQDMLGFYRTQAGTIPGVEIVELQTGDQAALAQSLRAYGRQDALLAVPPRNEGFFYDTLLQACKTLKRESCPQLIATSVHPDDFELPGHPESKIPGAAAALRMHGFDPGCYLYTGVPSNAPHRSMHDIARAITNASEVEWHAPANPLATKHKAAIVQIADGNTTVNVDSYAPANPIITKHRAVIVQITNNGDALSKTYFTRMNGLLSDNYHTALAPIDPARSVEDLAKTFSDFGPDDLLVLTLPELGNKPGKHVEMAYNKLFAACRMLEHPPQLMVVTNEILGMESQVAPILEANGLSAQQCVLNLLTPNSDAVKNRMNEILEDRPSASPYPYVAPGSVALFSAHEDGPGHDFIQEVEASLRSAAQNKYHAALPVFYVGDHGYTTAGMQTLLEKTGTSKEQHQQHEAGTIREIAQKNAIAVAAFGDRDLPSIIAFLTTYSEIPQYQRPAVTLAVEDLSEKTKRSIEENIASLGLAGGDIKLYSQSDLRDAGQINAMLEERRQQFSAMRIRMPEAGTPSPTVGTVHTVTAAPRQQGLSAS